MKRLNPKKLHVTYLNGTTMEDLVLPRRYTLTHSDRTGILFLTISNDYDTRQTSSLYTRLMRDEVLAEVNEEEDGLVFRVYCHVSGGFVFGTAKWRYVVFRHELPLVLEAIRFGDRNLFEKITNLDNTPVLIHFESTDNRFNKVENWGTIADYR
jgi:hypothetical protein